MCVAIDSISPESVLGIVNSLNLDGPLASFCFGTDQTPLSGKQCWVYAVEFPNGNIWAVRIPVHTRHLPPEAITCAIEEEATILKRLEQSGFAWSPKLVAYCSGFDNPIAFPYIISTWIRGTPLQWTEITPTCRKTRDKLLSQMGRILVQLAECSEQPGLGTDSAAYLTDIVDRKIIRVLDSGLPEISVQSCLLQRALVRMTFHGTAEPTLISHEDLDPSKIVVDDEYNVKGVIDWGFARTLPRQLAIGLPRFLGIEPSRLDESPPPDIAKFSAAFLQPSPTLRLDRQCIISHISSMVRAEGDQVNSVPYGNFVLSALSDDKIDWQRLLFESVSSRGLHRWMADRLWLLPSMNSAAVELNSSALSVIVADELGLFLTKIKEMDIEGHMARLCRALKSVA
ncbi:hypothetical protein TOPH_03792 [Tolypocladium ophioglossoides CBS 100239]|uniref:Aminoglycoside phosphotransferase domain-containing protein n=1 Tax=Tolypocladium ophioglossoides (strain CBS 100239) TaxID=1163406 RepID=A0A0L0NCG7_TOLOC|nr:hypothetical protein TOPH_03792 [Tolypocladium ophioglossoides CBS 100239]